MSLYSPNQEPKPLESNEIHLINPSIKEFKTSYLDDKNRSIEVVLTPMEVKSFPINIGKTILEHLIDFILNQEGFSYKTAVNIEREIIRERCVLYE